MDQNLFFTKVKTQNKKKRKEREFSILTYLSDFIPSLLNCIMHIPYFYNKKYFQINLIPNQDYVCHSDIVCNP